LPGIWLEPSTFAKRFQYVDFIRLGRNGLAVHNVCHFSQGPGLLDSGPVQPEEASQVDLTLRLNVLAVCVAIAFVSAVLVGAF
jgi:hypothetical protein